MQHALAIHAVFKTHASSASITLQIKAGMKPIPGYFAHYLYRPWLTRYLSKERSYRYEHITVRVLPGVFHPGFFFSTHYLLQYLLKADLRGHSLLEPGAGSGLISFVAEQHGAAVTASDLSMTAVQNLLLNKALLHSQAEVIHSDLFDQLPARRFDFIVINPPYYPKAATTDAALPWYCGADFEYYHKLFSALPSFMHAGTKTWMVLSEECNIGRIQEIATENKCRCSEVSRKKCWWEWNYIFEVTVAGDGDE